MRRSIDGEYRCKRFRATVAVSCKNNLIGQLNGNSKTNVLYDIRDVAVKVPATMLDSNIESPNLAGSFIVRTKLAQDIGTYELSSNIKMANKKEGTKTLGKAKVNSTVRAKNGMKYKVSTEEEGQYTDWNRPRRHSEGGRKKQ